MFRRLKIYFTDTLCDAHGTHAKSIEAEISQICKVVSTAFSDLTKAVELIIPCTQDILQFSNNKTCIRRHPSAGLFYCHVSNGTFRSSVIHSKGIN